MVFGRGENPINFVSVEDVAALLEMILTRSDLSGSTLEIGGPENLTLNELAGAIQTGTGTRKPPRHLSPIVLRALAATLGSLTPRLGRQMRSSLLMDSMDLSFDATAIHSTYPDLPATTVQEVLVRDRSNLTRDG